MTSVVERDNLTTAVASVVRIFEGCVVYDGPAPCPLCRNRRTRSASSPAGRVAATDTVPRGPRQERHLRYQTSR